MLKNSEFHFRRLPTELISDSKNSHFPQNTIECRTNVVHCQRNAPTIFFDEQTEDSNQLEKRTQIHLFSYDLCALFKLCNAPRIFRTQLHTLDASRAERERERKSYSRQWLFVRWRIRPATEIKTVILHKSLNILRWIFSFWNYEPCSHSAQHTSATSQNQREIYFVIQWRLYFLFFIFFAPNPNYLWFYSSNVEQ